MLHYLTLKLILGQGQSVAQYLLHYVTYAPAKFEVATSNRLRGDEFKRKYIL